MYMFGGTMAITTTELRQNIFRILDSVIELGRPVSIQRKGHIVQLVPTQKKNKLDNLKAHPFSDEPLEAFDHIDWTHEWTKS